MGVDHEIRHDAALGEGHVFLVGNEPDDTLLPVPGRELVADFDCGVWVGKPVKVVSGSVRWNAMS